MLSVTFVTALAPYPSRLIAIPAPIICSSHTPKKLSDNPFRERAEPEKFCSCLEEVLLLCNGAAKSRAMSRTR
jgi:hypothetical protein